MQIVIFGSGQVGNTAASILRECGHEVLGFVDDAAGKRGQQSYGLTILGDRNWLLNNSGYEAVCLGIGTIQARKSVHLWLKSQKIPTISAIHPSAIISKCAQLGDDLLIGANTTLYVNPVIGDGCFFGPSVTVSHDTIVGAYCLLSVGSVVGARCDIEDEVLIGTGATLMPPAFHADARLRVGTGAVIGVGSTVIKDVAANSTVVGSPAKQIVRK